MKKKGLKSGFTLIEATLGITFLGILLITIALLINFILSTYRKGLSMKTVNEIGRNLVEDMSTALAASPAKELTTSCLLSFSSESQAYKDCLDNKAYFFTYSQRYSSNISIDGDLIGSSVPVSGVFCTGKYSYIWNTGYVLGGEYSGEDPSEIIYNFQGEEKHITDFRLVKIPDSSRVACSSRIDNDYKQVGDTNKRYDLRKDKLDADYYLSAEPTELLKGDANGSAIYDFSIYQPAQDAVSQHIFISASFILGTIQGGIDITSTGDYCQTPDEGSDLGFNYCALNKFNFAMQTTGE